MHYQCCTKLTGAEHVQLTKYLSFCYLHKPEDQVIPLRLPLLHVLVFVPSLPPVPSLQPCPMVLSLV